MTNEEFEAKVKASSLPGHMHEGIISYTLRHQRPGGFLFTILSNDLEKASYCADSVNKHFLPDYIQFFRENLPAEAWGSEEKVRKWIK